MFSLDTNLYETPPAWWETNCVKFGLSYTAVRSRLTALMGSHVVRLTDRKYMIQLALKQQEDYEARQQDRIQRRRLKPTSIVSELPPKLSPKLLLKRTRRRQCAPKLDAEAARKCKQLPHLLLSNSSIKNSK